MLWHMFIFTVEKMENKIKTNLEWNVFSLQIIYLELNIIRSFSKLFGLYSNQSILL